MSLRYLTLKAAYFLCVTNQTFRTSFGKSIRKRSCDIIFGELLCARMVETYKGEGFLHQLRHLNFAPLIFLLNASSKINT